MTSAYSSRAPKTNITQTPLQTSIALVYATGGNLLFIPACVVDIASRVVTPSDTRAGTYNIRNFVVYPDDIDASKILKEMDSNNAA